MKIWYFFPFEYKQIQFSTDIELIQMKCLQKSQKKNMKM